MLGICTFGLRKPIHIKWASKGECNQTTFVGFGLDWVARVASLCTVVLPVCLLCANKQSTTWLGRTLKITSSWFSGTQLVIAARGWSRAGGGRTHSALCAFCGAYFQAQRNFIDNPKCCCSFNVCVCASVCGVYTHVSCIAHIFQQQIKHMPA